ncbi:hypothetical protein LIS82_23570 [Cytobacillus solani]|uniref:hypothetical protein n=1 Tax=Cytobacillus solani TaxID=1637975 RepID=UPI00207949CB|nr:hypothetical protein [Cytobacillus solani]USK54495.1 hypothetical protein LIS82_23570 [Cytobacillus solani]
MRVKNEAVVRSGSKDCFCDGGQTNRKYSGMPVPLGCFSGIPIFIICLDTSLFDTKYISMYVKIDYYHTNSE